MAYGPVNLDIFSHDGRLLSMPISTPAPEKLYRVVEYVAGNLFPVSNYYKTRAKARERRTRMLNAWHHYYDMIFDSATSTWVPNPQKAPIYGIQVCTPQWRGIE